MLRSVVLGGFLVCLLSFCSVGRADRLDDLFEALAIREPDEYESSRELEEDSYMSYNDESTLDERDYNDNEERFLNELYDLEEFYEVEKRGRSNRRRNRRPQFNLEDDFEIEDGCFAFKSQLSRYLLHLPELDDMVADGTTFNLHVEDIADRALAVHNLYGKARLSAKDVTSALTQEILEDMTHCRALKVFQALMFGLSRGFTKARQDEALLCNVTEELQLTLPSYIPIPIEKVVSEIQRRITYGLLQHFEGFAFGDLVETMEVLETSLMPVFTQSYVNQTLLLETINSALRNFSVSCVDPKQLVQLYRGLNDELDSLQFTDSAFNETRDELVGHIGAFVNISIIEDVATQMTRITARVASRVQRILRAFAGQNLRYLRRNKIVPRRHESLVRKLFNFVPKVTLTSVPPPAFHPIDQGSTSSRAKRSTLKERVLEKILLNLLKRENFARQSGTTDSAVTTGTLPQTTASAAVTTEVTTSAPEVTTITPTAPNPPQTTSAPFVCNLSLTSSDEVKSHPCFNFEVAVSHALAGFPENISTVEKVELDQDAIQGLIESSMLLQNLVADPNMVGAELTYSITEYVLEGMRSCPSTRFGQAVMYILARAFDRFETNVFSDLTTLSIPPWAQNKVDFINRRAVVHLLAQVSASEFRVLRRRMGRVMQTVGDALRSERASRRLLENRLGVRGNRFNQRRWTFPCNRNRTVRGQLVQIRRSLTSLIRNMGSNVRSHLTSLEDESYMLLNVTEQEVVVDLIENITVGFLQNVTGLFNAILHRDYNYLVGQGLLNDYQYNLFTQIFAEMGGQFLPSFVTPVVELGVDMQEVMASFVSASSIQELQSMKSEMLAVMTEKCNLLQHVRLRRNGWTVQKFLENCQLLNVS